MGNTSYSITSLEDLQQGSDEPNKIDVQVVDDPNDYCDEECDCIRCHCKENCCIDAETARNNDITDNAIV